MKRLLLLLAATALTAQPVLAQHQGHHMPMPPAKKPAAKKPAAKKPAAKKPAPKRAAAKKPAAKKPTAKPTAKKAVTKPTAKRPVKKAAPKKAPAADPHAGHVMPQAPAADPHAGHAMPQAPAAADTHAGHAMPQAPVADPHAGHAMPQASGADPHAGHAAPGAAADIPLAPPPAAALSGPEHAADAFWGTRAMARQRSDLLREHGGMSAYRLLIDRAETRARRGPNGYVLDAEAWVGGDIDKLWIKTEVEGSFKEGAEQAELQALWSHAIDPWFDVQAGIRLNAKPDRRARLVLGVQGLAPYWIEVDAAAFLSDKGDVTARVEAEHDIRVTRRLVLQPRAELDFSLQDIPRERLGSGLTSAELGLRLRYEIVPNFAPYVGVGYERAFGDTRRFLREDGDVAGGWSLIAGIRTWF